MPTLPRYPVYVPTKGRHETPYTIKFLIDDAVPFFVVVEPHEFDAYAEVAGVDRVLVLPWTGDDATRREFCAARSIENGGLIAVRNWIREHATAAGFARHWQLDDNIRMMRTWYKGRRLRCRAGVGFSVTEDFVDRYENIGVAGLNYTMFAHKAGANAAPADPFWLNCHVYSCSLINHAMPAIWRLAYNDDTDLCLQALSTGWCTLAMNAFMCDKLRTMTVKGGNTEDLYQGDGRLVMARSLERKWPGIVETRRRFGRPQHVVKAAWRYFDTPLRRRSDLDWSALGSDADALTLQVLQVEPEIKSKELRKLVRQSR